VRIWRCPDYRALSGHEAETASAFYRNLRCSAGDGADPVRSAGLELRAVLMSLQVGSDQARADNDFWKRKCRAVFLRPAMEPIAHSYWKKLSSFEIDDLTALKAASALAGGPLVYRKGPATGKSTNGDVHFPPLEDQKDWLARLGSAARDPALMLALPAIAFAQTVLTHPFSDANGRFGRLMVHVALGRCADLRGPTIALAPAFYRNAESLGAALTQVSERGDWSGFYRVFFGTLVEALVAIADPFVASARRSSGNAVCT